MRCSRNPAKISHVRKNCIPAGPPPRKIFQTLSQPLPIPIYTRKLFPSLTIAAKSRRATPPSPCQKSSSAEKQSRAIRTHPHTHTHTRPLRTFFFCFNRSHMPRRQLDEKRKTGVEEAAVAAAAAK